MLSLLGLLRLALTTAKGELSETAISLTLMLGVSLLLVVVLVGVLVVLLVSKLLVAVPLSRMVMVPDAPLALKTPDAIDPVVISRASLFSKIVSLTIDVLSKTDVLPVGIVTPPAALAHVAPLKNSIPDPVSAPAVAVPLNSDGMKVTSTAAAEESETSTTACCEASLTVILLTEISGVEPKSLSAVPWDGVAVLFVLKNVFDCVPSSTMVTVPLTPPELRTSPVIVPV